MPSETAYAINEAKTISETLDGETIIINLENGNYYSVNATGSVLWELISSGHTQTDMLTYLRERYEGEPETIRASLVETLGLLTRDGLVIEVTGTSKPLPATSATKVPFVPMAIERYEDMQEMLLADPIHDVDRMGWPHLKPTVGA